LGSYVQYAVGVSDPTEALANETHLVFTHENWNMGIQLAIQGVEDCESCGKREDGDIPYTVDFFLSSTNDKNFTDVEGARLPFLNRDQVVNRLAISTDYNCKISDANTDNSGNMDFRVGTNSEFAIGGNLGAFDVGQTHTPIQNLMECWDPNVTAVWQMDQSARYDFAGDKVFDVVYDSPYSYEGGSNPPTPVPTMSKSPIRSPTMAPTVEPTAYSGETKEFAVGCVLDEQGKNPCRLQLSVCQASTDATSYDRCDVVLPYTETYAIGVESIVIHLWLDDPTEAEFVKPFDDPGWYTTTLIRGSHYCESEGGPSGVATQWPGGFLGDSASGCIYNSSKVKDLAESAEGNFMAEISIDDQDDNGPSLLNYSVPVYLRGKDDNLIDGDQMFRINTRAYIKYSGGTFFPATAEDCEKSTTFPKTFLGPEANPSLTSADCYLAMGKYYDMIGQQENGQGGGLNTTFFYAVTIDDDDEPQPYIELDSECNVDDNGFPLTSEAGITQSAGTCPIYIKLDAQPQSNVTVTVEMMQPSVNCSQWSDNVACEDVVDGEDMFMKTEALIALETNVEGTRNSTLVTLTPDNWNVGVKLWIVGYDDKYYEGENYEYGGYAANAGTAGTKSNGAGVGDTTPYHVWLRYTESEDLKFHNMPPVKVPFYNTDNEAGAMSIFSSPEGTTPECYTSTGTETSVFGGSTCSSSDDLTSPNSVQGRPSSGDDADSELEYPKSGVGYSVDENGRYQYFGTKFVSTPSDWVNDDGDTTVTNQFYEIPVFVSVSDADSSMYTELPESYDVLDAQGNSRTQYAFTTGQTDAAGLPLVVSQNYTNNLIDVELSNAYDCVLDYDKVASGEYSLADQTAAYENLWWEYADGTRDDTYSGKVISQNYSFVGCMRVYEKNYWQYGKYTGLDDSVVQTKNQYTRGRTAYMDFGPTIVWECDDPDDISSGCQQRQQVTGTNLTFSMEVNVADNDVLEISKTECTTTEISGTGRLLA
jgi:hypothetical protein